MSSAPLRRLRDRERDGVLPILVAVTVVALLARLYALGWRVAHQDEGRVGSWILHYVEYGEWQYRAIIHGPFLPHVNGVVFSLFGASGLLLLLPLEGLEFSLLAGVALVLSMYWIADGMRGGEVNGCPVDVVRR
ncbi:hypothetical protein ACFQE1_10400 [Halobium palmae]|uniref:Uncharacterized protein n=1 Tax=Halobium palmae TaxID=1776492 RepID=A0ABD5RZL6_9EURY